MLGAHAFARRGPARIVALAAVLRMVAAPENDLAPSETSGNQRKSAGVKAETLHNAKGRIYRKLKRLAVTQYIRV